MERKSGNYKKYTSINPLMKLATDGFLDDVVSLVSSVDADTILDVGCGEGFVSSRLGDRNLVGIDASRRALALARGISPDSAFALCDVRGLPFRPNSFDLVMELEVLEHLDEPGGALSMASTLSKRYCLFSVPHEPYFRAMDVLRGKNLGRLGNDPEHRHNWTAKGFERLVSAHFDVIDVKKPFPWTMILCEKKYACRN